MSTHDNTSGTCAQSVDWLHDIVEQISQGRIWAALSCLRDYLRSARTDPERWKQTVAQLSRWGPLNAALYSCPYTQRARQKPRGYAGDAIMMDYVYGIYPPDFTSAIDHVGEEIFRFTTNSAAARAVRSRRRHIAAAIDSVASAGGANILALASGHLREAAISSALASGAIEKLIAVDQDAESLEVVARDYANCNVETEQASAVWVSRGRIPSSIRETRFDLVYSAGLYDYLNDAIATRLTAQLASLLKECGCLLLTNFVPMHEDIGFMEGVMDWKLVYRTPEQLADLVREAGLWVDSVRIDPNACIVYVIARKIKEPRSR